MMMKRHVENVVESSEFSDANITADCAATLSANSVLTS